MNTCMFGGIEMMKKQSIVSFVVLILLLMAGCSAPTDIDVKYGENFTLKPGQKANLPDDFSIRFIQVEEDSRCPNGATCVWEGNGKVLLEFLEPGIPARPFRLNTHEQFTTDTVIQGYSIYLQQLSPYPVVDQQIDPKSYTVELLVTK